MTPMILDDVLPAMSEPERRAVKNVYGELLDFVTRELKLARGLEGHAEEAAVWEDAQVRIFDELNNAEIAPPKWGEED